MNLRAIGGAIAVAGLLVSAVFLPLSIVGGQLGIVMLLVGTVLAWFGGARDFFPRALAVPVLAFIAVALLMTVASSVEVPRDGWTAWRPLLFAPLVPAAIALSGRPERLARLALVAFLVSASGAAVLGLVQRSTGYDLNYSLGLRAAPIRVPAPIGERYSAIGFFNSRLTFAAVEAAAVVLALGALVAARSLWARLAGAVALALTGAAVTATFARAAWIGVVLGVLCMVAGLRRKAAMALLAVAVIGGAAAAAVPAVRTRAVSAVQTTANPERLFIWSRAGEVLADHPGEGVGMYAYPIIASPYYDRADPNFPMHTWAHDMFFTVLLETGIAGLVAYLWVFVVALAAAFRAMHGEPTGAWSAVRLGAIGATVSLLGWSLFHDALYDGEVAMTLFFVTGLAAAGLPKRKTASEATTGASAEGPAVARLAG